jgi:hypothetical protein
MDVVSLAGWVGGARAISPDAPCGHPALRSLDGGCALGILPSLAANAGSIGTGTPSRQSKSWRTPCSFPAVGVADGDHGLEDGVPGVRVFEGGVGEHAAVPADVLDAAGGGVLEPEA